MEKDNSIDQLNPSGIGGIFGPIVGFFVGSRKRQIQETALNLKNVDLAQEISGDLLRDLKERYDQLTKDYNQLLSAYTKLQKEFNSYRRKVSNEQLIQQKRIQELEFRVSSLQGD